MTAPGPSCSAMAQLRLTRRARLLRCAVFCGGGKRLLFNVLLICLPKLVYAQRSVRPPAWKGLCLGGHSEGRLHGGRRAVGSNQAAAAAQRCALQANLWIILER